MSDWRLMIRRMEMCVCWTKTSSATCSVVITSEILRCAQDDRCGWLRWAWVVDMILPR
jgi:hypothetical protein